MVQISPSVLAADLASLKSEIATVENSDRLHLDVMDGHFVPNISFGPPVIKSIQRTTSLPLDVHLMATDPSRHIERLIGLPIDSISFHSETTDDLTPLVAEIQRHGMAAGVAISPETSVDAIQPVLDSLDKVVVMGVKPGFTGQTFVPSVLQKVEDLAENNNIVVEIDGGINEQWAEQSIAAGADIVVSGSTIFDSEDREATIRRLRGKHR